MEYTKLAGQDRAWAELGLHVIAKPIGAVCNLRCAYCFYLEKEALYQQAGPRRMSDATLEAYVRQYLDAQPEGVDEVNFAWQGGEPTLMGLDFYRRAVAIQAKYAGPGVRVQNALQTNGILLDDAWCRFLKEHGFLVGLSIDGPGSLHDRYRVDPNGQGTFARVAAAMRLLRKHDVSFNTLTCVHRHNGDHPGRVYRFLRDAGVEFMQFIPIVEPVEHAPGVKSPDETEPEPRALVTDRSVRPGQFGRFLIGLFDEWVCRDVGRVFVRDFDQALSAWAGVEPSLCVYAKSCGRATAIEHNGDLFACDHFVTAEHQLGNIHETPIAKMANSPRQAAFGRDKWATLPACCQECDFLAACNGACPKDRFLRSADGEPGLNYLCQGFREFFSHVASSMQWMAGELRAGRPAAGIMRRLRAEKERSRDATARDGPVGRNARCPCGSGRKYKSCCMRRRPTAEG